MKNQSLFQESTEVMREFVSKGAISPLPLCLQRYTEGNAGLLGNLLDQLRGQRAKTLERSPWLGQQSTWQLPATRRYQQSRAPSSLPLTQPDPLLNWMVELARWPVAYGSIGIIKSFEQYLSDEIKVHTQSENWGNPFPFPSVTMTWHFRLSPVAHLGRPWVNTSGPSAISDYLPGIPYEDFSISENIWFPAGSCPAGNIHLPIPGGYVLRVFFMALERESNPLSVAVKLSGTTQVETNDATQFMARTSW